MLAYMLQVTYMPTYMLFLYVSYMTVPYGLVELCHGSTGAEIAKAVLRSFDALGEEILRSRLIGFASDGASVMTGRYEGSSSKRSFEK